jgi:hypothetical protein
MYYQFKRPEISMFSPHNALACCHLSTNSVYFPRQYSAIGFITESGCVYRAVRTESLINLNFSTLYGQYVVNYFRCYERWCLLRLPSKLPPAVTLLTCVRSVSCSYRGRHAGKLAGFRCIFNSCWQCGDDVISHGPPTVVWQRAAPFIAGLFACRTWTKNHKWYT